MICLLGSGVIFHPNFFCAGYSLFLQTYSPPFSILLYILCSRAWLCRMNQMPSGFLLGLANNHPAAGQRLGRESSAYFLPSSLLPLLWVAIGWVSTKGHHPSQSFNLHLWIPATVPSSCPSGRWGWQLPAVVTPRCFTSWIGFPKARVHLRK